MSRRGNPYPHRYRYSPKPITFDLFKKLMGRVEKVDRAGYSVDFIKAAHALFFWTGLRKTEVLGRKPIKYLVDHKPCKGKGCEACVRGKVVKAAPGHKGLVKEDFQLNGDWLLVFSVGEKVLKHGKRRAPIWLYLELPYVGLIVDHWRKVKPGQTVFRISPICFWRICKRMDPKFTLHFYRHNRITDLCADAENSIADVCSQSGLSPATVSAYMMRLGRFTKDVGERMKRKYQEA